MRKSALKKAKAFIDGASRGNPGPAAIGVVFQDLEGKLVKELSIKIGDATNNVAEYMALIFALQEGLMMRVGELDVFTDSELLARQYSGEYKVKDPVLRRLALQVKHLNGGFDRMSVSHIPRERNTLADRQANEALDAPLFSGAVPPNGGTNDH